MLRRLLESLGCGELEATKLSEVPSEAGEGSSGRQIEAEPGVEAAPTDPVAHESGHR
jgi:hypothetical protein